MLLFKILGFLMIIFTTAAIGFSKSAELFWRHKKLCSIRKGITVLKERIRLCAGETDRLIEQSFETFPLDYSYLEKEDTEIVDEFFKTLGMSDTTAECERCELYITLLEERIKEAEKRYREQGKLYRSIGIMSGIFVCIFFL